MIILAVSSLMTNEVFSEIDIDETLKEAKIHVLNGEYKQAIQKYDVVLETDTNNVEALEMKGILFNISEDYTNSLKQFYKILQKNPNNVRALTGMGVGFGNLGEYEESLSYLHKAEIQEPNNEMIQNYKKLVENTIVKYPYISTEKPIDNRNQNSGSVPIWVKDVVKWWSITKLVMMIF